MNSRFQINDVKISTELTWGFETVKCLTLLQHQIKFANYNLNRAKIQLILNCQFLLFIIFPFFHFFHI